MPLEGTQLGRYRLVNLVGSGNMGEVFLAEDTQLNRQVAIKIMRSEASSYPNADAVKEAARLFQREAKAIAALDHPHILPLYDYGEQTVNGTLMTYMVMPLRREGSLATWLQQRGATSLLSFEETAYFVRQAADALQHAHNHRITHQDVKPSNFLIRRNEEAQSLPDLQLADFGIARISSATASTSRTIRGTPAYMAPEQWSGNPVQASDQYALAVMAYDLLTGRLPFQGTLENLMYKHFQEQPQPPSQLNPKLPPEVDAVFRVALAKQPQERFASVSAFAEALRQALHLQSTGAIPVTDEPTFVRTPPPPAGGDIHTSLAISMAEAVSGTRRTLTFPDGRQISVTIPAGAYHGQVMRLEGLGQPSPYGGPSGALLLSIVVTPAETVPAITNPEKLSQTIAVAPPPPPLPPSSAGTSSSSIRRGFPTSIVILLVVLALLVGLGAGFLYLTKGSSSNPGSGTPTATVQNTLTTGVTPANQSNATATAQASETAIASQNPYGSAGTLVLNDSLSTNSNAQWQTGTNNLNASCQFTGGAYHVTQPAQGYFHSCTADNTNYTNFAFEVQMITISGDYAGIIFCKEDTNSYYLFYIKTDGSYFLYRNVDANIADAIQLASGSTSINLSQMDTIAVVVNQGTIQLFANRQLITTVSDATYTRGAIAVLTGNDTRSAETIFTNARVWQL
jgi:eukaryotic-like serine/threonine-protein kinase